jgi:uncharacterized protein YneF (UPF0154 family)
MLEYLKNLSNVIIGSIVGTIVGAFIAKKTIDK